MPIPFLLWGAAAALGAVGVKKGLDAKSDMNEADDYNKRAKALVDNASANTDVMRKSTSKAVEKLGETKLLILSGSIRKFVKTFSKIKNVDFHSSVGMEELENFSADSGWFDSLEKASFKAADLMQGGMGGLAAGTVLAAGAYGAVASGLGGLAVASTGAAIGGLSGVAATNATLAWLGGGSLAAGGFGMAGGMVVLGGLVAGPALAIGGFWMASKAEEAKYKAWENYDKAQEYEEQCKCICSKLSAITDRAVQIQKILQKLDRYMDVANDALIDVVLDYGNDYRQYPQQQRNTVGACAQLAKTMKIILDTSLLTESGDLTSQSADVQRISDDFSNSKSMRYLEEA